VPPEYVLRRAAGPEQEEDEALRRVLVRAGRTAKLTDAERAPFEASATHREIRLGLLDVPSDPHHDAGVLCALRAFRGRMQGPELARFVERDAERVRAVRGLTEAVTRRLPREQVLRYEVEWRGEAGPDFDAHDLAQRYLSLLRPRVEAVMAARTAARKALAAQGRDAAALANASFEAQRAAHVEAREAELDRLGTYLAGTSDGGLPLVVTGAAGSGKSTLLAEAAKRAAAAHPGAVLLVRYIGVTPGTSSLFELLAGLRRAIASAYGQRESEPMADLYQLIDAFATQLSDLDAPAEHPLLLVIDALDQLSANPQPTEWLPRSLPANVRVVVSVLPDRPELAELNGRLPAEQVLILGPLSRAAGRAVLCNLLAADGPHHSGRTAHAQPRARTLAVAQENIVLDGFTARGLPLYLQVAAGEARRWRSFDPAEPLPDSIPALLDRILTRLEEKGRHGPVLVAHALGDLAAARNGLVEEELLALLAKDETVRHGIHELSEHSPPIRDDLPLPAALWARLYAEIERLLTEREADGAQLYTFYHRQLREAVQKRYLARENDRERHRALAAYFESQPAHDWQPAQPAQTLRAAYPGGGRWARCRLAADFDRPILPRAQDRLSGHKWLA
jgi:hypothetical protein